MTTTATEAPPVDEAAQAAAAELLASLKRGDYVLYGNEPARVKNAVIVGEPGVVRLTMSVGKGVTSITVADLTRRPPLVGQGGSPPELRKVDEREWAMALIGRLEEELDAANSELDDARDEIEDLNQQAKAPSETGAALAMLHEQAHGTAWPFRVCDREPCNRISTEVPWTGPAPSQLWLEAS